MCSSCGVKSDMSVLEGEGVSSAWTVYLTWQCCPLLTSKTPESSFVKPPSPLESSRDGSGGDTSTGLLAKRETCHAGTVSFCSDFRQAAQIPSHKHVMDHATNKGIMLYDQLLPDHLFERSTEDPARPSDWQTRDFTAATAGVCIPLHLHSPQDLMVYEPNTICTTYNNSGRLSLLICLD
jgi:hypothetical protein